MEMLQQLLAIGLVLGLLVLFVWMLKRRGFATVRTRPSQDPRTRMEVIDRLALTPQHSIHLIRMADRMLLVALSPQNCSLLETTSVTMPAGVER